MISETEKTLLNTAEFRNMEVYKYSGEGEGDILHLPSSSSIIVAVVSEIES